MLITHRYRVKDANVRAHLRAMAVEVNQVWNFCGGIQNDSRRLNRQWPTGYSLMKLTSGAGAMMGLHSDTVAAVCQEWVKSRDKARHRPRWRTSFGARRALGWIPFRHVRAIRVDGDVATFLKKRYRLWMSRPIDGEIRCGSFSEDAAGRWYLNLVLKVDESPARETNRQIGIDLGLKHLASLSDGSTIEHPRYLRKSAARLAAAQRAARKKLARAIHRKVANQRKDFLHRVSTDLVRRYDFIAVGDVSSSNLAKTSMAKSVLDAGWSTLRHQIRYKAMRHGSVFVETNERYSSQTCSTCGTLPASRPKGIAGLGVRSWVCSDCGGSHDRDHNAALNILRSGRNAVLQGLEIAA